MAVVSHLFYAFLYGGLSLKVVEARLTNIPIVQARELRMDSLFEFEDGSVAVLDYESDYRKANFASPAASSPARLIR